MSPRTLRPCASASSHTSEKRASPSAIEQLVFLRENALGRRAEHHDFLARLRRAPRRVPSGSAPAPGRTRPACGGSPPSPRALSAICGTHLGETNAVASITGSPASCRRWISSTLTAVGTGAASFCSPSRGPTSTSFTRFGRLIHRQDSEHQIEPPRRQGRQENQNRIRDETWCEWTQLDAVFYLVSLLLRLGARFIRCSLASWRFDFLCFLRGGGGPRGLALLEEGGQPFLRFGRGADVGDALRGLLDAAPRRCGAPATSGISFLTATIASGPLE